MRGTRELDGSAHPRKEAGSEINTSPFALYNICQVVLMDERELCILSDLNSIICLDCLIDYIG